MIVRFAVLKSGLVFFSLQQSMLTAFNETRMAGESSWSATSTEAIELLHQERGAEIRVVSASLRFRV